MRDLIAMALSLVGLSGAATATPVESDFEWRTTMLMQGLWTRRVWGPAFANQPVDSGDIELRADVQGQCTDGGCRGTGVVLKPRVHERDTDPSFVGVAQPRHAWFREIYAMRDIGETASVTVGKRYLGWGAGLLYSPTNRLFPDNGSATPRREIDGKLMALGSTAVSPSLTVSALVADPYVADEPGVDRSAAFRLLHVEWQSRDERPSSGGVVWGGGGGYRSYVGGYAQKLLNDAWTLGGELSASRGFAVQRDAGTGRRADTERVRYDALLNLRYGLASGGEFGVEIVYNGFRLSDADYQNPTLSTQPAGGGWQSRYFVRHPLPEARYLLLQGQWPRLAGDRRWTLFARHLRGLQYSGGMTYAELGYSPTDDLTLYVGVTRTDGTSRSAFVNALDREVYLAVEFHF